MEIFARLKRLLSDNYNWQSWRQPSLEGMYLAPNTEQNPLMIQFFTWDSQVKEGSWWQRFEREVPNLADLGFTLVWLPPPNKAMVKEGRGYDAYDLWDLGEFDQKGTVSTRWGSKEELVNACSTSKAHGIGVLIDGILGHKLGGDRTEKFKAIPVESDNRLVKKGPAREIESWTAFDFLGRGNEYSEFKWNHRHFTGVDWDAKTRTSDIYYIEDPSRRGWSRYVDKELGNYDYLLGCDIDHRQPDVKEDLLKWGQWVLKTTGAIGFRLDAIKHMDRRFLLEFLKEVRSDPNHSNLFAVAEYWSSDFDRIGSHIRFFEGLLSFFDVPLHNNFHNASKDDAHYDLRSIFKGTVVEKRPGDAVTFVDNHDTQIGQSLESWVCSYPFATKAAPIDIIQVSANFKIQSYTLILLRDEGCPCVFYGDLYPNDECYDEDTATQLKVLIQARKKFAYGTTVDYFQYRNCIGFVRLGNDKAAGCVVIIRSSLTRDDLESELHDYGEEIRMKVNQHGEYHDLMGDSRRVTVGPDGYSIFPCRQGKVAVWVVSES